MNQFGINRSLLFRPYRTLNDLKSDSDLDVNMYCLTVDDGKLYKVVNNTVRTMADLFTTINEDTLDTTSGIIRYSDPNMYDHVMFDKFDEFDSTQITKLNNSNMGIVVGKGLILGEMCHIILHLEGIVNNQGFRRVAIRVVNERNGEELMMDFVPDIQPLSIKTGDILTLQHNPRGFVVYKNNEDFRSINIGSVLSVITKNAPIDNYIPKMGLAVDEMSETGNVARFNIGNERIADVVLPNGKKLIGASMTMQNIFIDGNATISGTGTIATASVGTLSVSGNAVVNGATTLHGAVTTNQISTSDVTVRKNGNYSKILFPAVSNDPGFISHYESNNTAYMDFCVSDDDIHTDIFRFGFGTSPGSFTSRAHITAGGNMSGVTLTASTNLVGPKLTLGGWEITVV